MDSYRILEDVNHLGGKSKGDIVQWEGPPKGQLLALVKFGQAELVGGGAEPRRGTLQADDKKPADKPAAAAKTAAAVETPADTPKRGAGKPPKDEGDE